MKPKPASPDAISAKEPGSGTVVPGVPGVRRVWPVMVVLVVAGMRRPRLGVPAVRVVIPRSVPAALGVARAVVGPGARPVLMA